MSRYHRLFIYAVLLVVAASAVAHATQTLQYVPNRTDGVWYSYRVVLENAYIDITQFGTINVYNSYSRFNPGQGDDWIITLLKDTPDATTAWGFQAWTKMENPDPVKLMTGLNTNDEDRLYVYFQYTCDGSGNTVKFIQTPFGLPGPVPEPSSLAALLMGTCGMAGWALRRRRNRL